VLTIYRIADAEPVAPDAERVRYTEESPEARYPFGRRQFVVEFSREGGRW
jgi:hypothetical protein